LASLTPTISSWASRSRRFGICAGTAAGSAHTRGPAAAFGVALAADELGAGLDEDALGLVPPWLHPAISTTAASPIARVPACVRGGAIRPCCHGGSPLR
jgi:hypothetical protein